MLILGFLRNSLQMYGNLRNILHNSRCFCNFFTLSQIIDFHLIAIYKKEIVVN